MSSSRVSFGSRAGTAFDYPGGEVIIRSSTHTGAYDSLDALADALRTEIAAAAESEEPECTTLELSLSAGAVLELVRPGVGPYSDGGEQDLPVELKQMMGGEGEDDDNQGNGNGNARPRHPRAFVGHTINIADARQSAIVQRAASRGVIQAIENADGFRYSFNNAWTAKDGEGSRFSYICQDSMQNKDRHANGYPRTIKHLKGDIGSRGPRKPTYDCKGSVSIKFSTTKQRCDVYYRHYAIHSTVADRAQVPRPPAVRRPFVSRGALLPQDVNSNLVAKPSGGLLATLQAETYASSALAMVDRTEPSNIGRPLKRKRDDGPAKPRNLPSKPMSLMEILSQSESAIKSSTASDSNNRQPPSRMPAPIAYELPSWQTPPPPLNNQRHDGTPAGYPAPYQPPYQPPQNRTPPPSVTATHLQPVKHRPPFKQKSPGQPDVPQPQPQGLFTTLKPMVNYPPANLPGTMYAPTATMHQNQSQVQSPPALAGYEMMQRHRRAKTSCVRCRQGKKKVCFKQYSTFVCMLIHIQCDEGLPCSACVKSGFGTMDCVYEGPPPFDADPTSFTPGGNRLPWKAHEKPSPFPVNSNAAAYPQSSAAANSQPLPWDTPASRTSSTPRSSSSAWRPAAMTSGGVERAGSPDPWFPKR